MGACRPPLGLPPPPHGWNGDRDDHRQLSGCVAPAGPISPSLEFFLKFIYFIYLCLRWVFVAARGLSLVATSGGYSSLWCTGFLLWWLLLLQSTGSRPTGFSSCSTRAQQLWHTGLVVPHGVRDLPRPGLEPVSPALAGGFLTTVPPGKSHSLEFLKVVAEKGISALLVTVEEGLRFRNCQQPLCLPQGGIWSAQHRG